MREVIECAVIAELMTYVVRKKKLEPGCELPPRKMREVGAGEVGFADAKEMAQVSERLALYAVHIGIQALQKKRPQMGRKIFSPEAADFRFLEDVVAAEDLVRAFTGQDDFEPAVSNQPGEQKHRCWCSPENGLFAVPDDLRNGFCDLGGGADEATVIRVKECTGLLLEAGLVVFGVVEGNRKASEPVAYDACCEGGGHGGVDAAAKVGSDRDVRAKADLCCVEEEVSQVVRQLLFVACELSALWRKRKGPIPLDAKTILIDNKRATGRELRDVLERGSRRDGGPEGKDLIESMEIEFC